MTTSNQLIFDLAKRTADTIVQMFGKNCEVAVHDFSNLDESLIYLSGSVTNRKIGSPATNLVLEELQKKSSKVHDIPNYKTHARNGVMLKSATVFLRDKQEKVIGALCINYNINNLLSLDGMLQDLLTFDNQENKLENFNTSINDVMDEMIDQVAKKFSKAPASLNLKSRIEFIKQLDEKGIFLIRGSAEYVATIFGVSKFTIYNDLQKTHVNNQNTDDREVDQT